MRLKVCLKEKHRGNSLKVPLDLEKSILAMVEAAQLKS